MELLAGAYYGKYDKSVHFVLSAAITAALLALGWLPLPVVAVVALAAGALKEAWDFWWRKSRFDLADLFVDALGVAAAFGGYFILVSLAVRAAAGQ